MKPYFTIIIPSYNHAHFLRLSIADLMNQTIQDWECIVVDNQSNDNTKEVVESFHDKRLKIITIDNMGSIAKSRNIGIKMAEGTWLAFLDSDDRWYPHRLEIIQNNINANTDAVVFSTDEKVINQLANSESINYYGPYESFFYEKLLTFGNRLSTSATVVNKDFINKKALKFSENIKYITVEDYDFWMRIAKSGAVFKFISEVCGEYIVHGNNATNKLELHYANLRAMLYDHLDSLKSNSKVFWILFIKSIIDIRIDLRYSLLIFRLKKNPKFLLKIFHIFTLRLFPLVVYLIFIGILKKRAKCKR